MKDQLDSNSLALLEWRARIRHYNDMIVKMMSLNEWNCYEEACSNSGLLKHEIVLVSMGFLRSIGLVLLCPTCKASAMFSEIMIEIAMEFISKCKSNNAAVEASELGMETIGLYTILRMVAGIHSGLAVPGPLLATAANVLGAMMRDAPDVPNLIGAPSVMSL